MARDKNTLEYRRLRNVRNLDESDSTYTYIGFEHPDSAWVIMKIDKTSGMIFYYATQTLNPTVTTYSSAWTNKATLVYGTPPEAF